MIRGMKCLPVAFHIPARTQWREEHCKSDICIRRRSTGRKRRQSPVPSAVSPSISGQQNKRMSECVRCISVSVRQFVPRPATKDTTKTSCRCPHSVCSSHRPGLLVGHKSHTGTLPPSRLTTADTTALQL